MHRVVLVLLFTSALPVMHRGAWRGWFQHDDFAHLSWTTQVRLPAFLMGMITPRFSPESAPPAGATWFELVANVGPEHLRQRGAVQVRVFVGGSPSGIVRFEREGRQSRRLALAEQPSGTVRVEFRVPEELTLPRREGGRLGAAIAFGLRQ